MNEGSNILSHGTAISRSGLSSPAKFIKPLLDKESMILDYGCGRGGDVERLNKEGFNVEGYDPHWMDIDLSLKSNYYDIILCTYVLNVLPKSQEDSVLLDIRDKLKDNGTAYIIYAGDSCF